MSISVPITTAAGMGPLPSLLEKMSGQRSVWRIFDKERLPLILTEDPSMRLPTQSLSNLFERAGHEAGDRTFGLQVGEAMTPGNYGMWTEYSSSAPNLAAALTRICRTISFHQTGSRMGLHRVADHVVWSYFPQTAEVVGRHYQDHVIPVMRRFVSAYLGKDWVPSWIELAYPEDTDSFALLGHWQTEMRFGTKALGIAIPVDKMTAVRRMQIDRVLTNVDLVAHARKQRAEDPEDAIEAIVALRLVDRQVDIEGVALLAGVSVRTLQRVMNRGGYSYRQLLDRIRHRRARSLLLDSDIAISDIAIMLGYDEPGNFTRAFRRWAGLAPIEFRTISGAVRV